MVKIVIDSTADIPDSLREEFDIRVVPLNVRFGDAVFRDGVDITKDQFYHRLVTGNDMPATSTPALGAFVETYQQLARETDAILSIHLSGKLSGTVEVARQAAALVPGVRIAVVDSQFTAMIMVFMAVAAAVAAREGKELDELVALVQGIAARSFLYVGLDTLRYLEKGGRIGRARAFLGTLLNVKPLVEVRDGEVHPLEQVRTSKRMLARMVELTQAQGPLEALAVCYTSDRAIADTVADQLASRGIFPREHMYVVQMGAVIGTHVGPGGVGLMGVRQR